MKPRIRIGIGLAIAGLVIVIFGIIFLLFALVTNFYGATGWFGYLLVIIGGIHIVSAIIFFCSLPKKE